MTADMTAGRHASQLWSRRNVALFLCALCLTVGPGIGSRPVLIAGEFLLVLLLLQWYSSRQILRPLAVRRDHYPRTFEDAVVTINLTLRNESPAAAHLVEITDLFPPGAESRLRSLATLLPGHSEATFRYRQPCTRHRGLYILGPVHLRACDPLGFFTQEQTCDEVSTLTVYPSAVPLPNFDTLGRGTQPNIGEQVVRNLGRSEEFASIRKYRSGDPPRLIHWPTTARFGEPYVKEFERSIITEITLLCDMRLIALSGLGNQTSTEYRIKAAASIATECIRHQHRVRIVAVKEPVEQTPMSGGHQHLVALLDWLALLKPGGPCSFEEQIEQVAPTLRAGATVVLVMSAIHIDLPRLVNAVRLLRLHRVRVLTAVVNDRTFLKLRWEQDEAYYHAPPLETVRDALRHEGCTVFTIGRDDDLAARLGVPA